MDFRIKPCTVILQQCTPKSQIGLSQELRNIINQNNILTARTRKKVLLDLDEISNINIEKDNETQQIRIIEEILTSEKSYLAQLHLIRDFFMKPVKDGNLLTEENYQLLFGNIDTIYNISNELLRELNDDKDVAKAFSKIAPFLKLYSVYAYDYKQSLKVLQNCHSNPKFSKFMEIQETRPEVQTKLSALLITPIQRVPRYCLLLKQLLNYTSSHSYYSLLKESLQNVEKAAVHINNLIEEQENSQRLLELQLSLQNRHPAIIKPDRKLIKTGILMKMNENSDYSSKRYFVLLNDILMYCKLKKDNPNSNNSLKCLGILPLNKCKITPNLDKGAFKIFCQNETIAVYHDHAEVAQEWIETLDKTIKTYLINRRTLRKDSSARRPVHKKLVSEYQDLGISPGQPRKKRILKQEEINYGSPTFENENSEIKFCFPLKARKRKAIRNFEETQSTPQKIQKGEFDKVHDSLFPLRKHLAKADSSCVPEEKVNSFNLNSTPLATNQNAIFVFGENHPPQNFRFTMGNILTSVGNSFKRIFGLKIN